MMMVMMMMMIMMTPLIVLHMHQEGKLDILGRWRLDQLGVQAGAGCADLAGDQLLRTACLTISVVLQYVS